MLIPVIPLGAAGFRFPSRIPYSLRLPGAAGTSLRRTPTVEGDRKTWTFSAWVRFLDAASSQTILSAGDNSNNEITIIHRTPAGLVQVAVLTGGVTVALVSTLAQLADTSGWYHLVVAYDATAESSSRRVRISVNGVDLPLSEQTPVALNQETHFNSTWTHVLGEYHSGSGANPLCGRIAAVRFVDGEALGPEAFGRLVPVEDMPPVVLDEVPPMTGDTTPSGVVTTSSKYSNYGRWEMFDKKLGAAGTGAGAFHWSSGSMPQWAQYQFPTPRVIHRTRLANWLNKDGGGITDFQMLGSTDAFTWDVLLEVSGRTPTAGAVTEHDLTAPAAYLYYRLNILAFQSGSNPNAPNLAEWYLLSAHDTGGLWVPARYTGDLGPNGFALDFADAANLGESWNDNDFTVSGSPAQSLDTPTDCFAVRRAGGYPSIRPSAGRWAWLDATKYGATRSSLTSGTPYSGSYAAPRAFDGLLTGNSIWGWMSANPTLDWLIVGFSSPIKLRSYRVYYNSYHLRARDPRSWVVSGSENASDWTELHTVTDQPEWDGVSEPYVDFTVNSDTAYSYIKIHSTAWRVGNSYGAHWQEIEITQGLVSHDCAVGGPVPVVPADTDFGAEGGWEPPAGYHPLSARGCIVQNVPFEEYRDVLLGELS